MNQPIICAISQFPNRIESRIGVKNCLCQPVWYEIDVYEYGVGIFDLPLRYLSYFLPEPGGVILVTNIVFHKGMISLHKRKHQKDYGSLITRMQCSCRQTYGIGGTHLLVSLHKNRERTTFNYQTKVGKEHTERNSTR